MAITHANNGYCMFGFGQGANNSKPAYSMALPGQIGTVTPTTDLTYIAGVLAQYSLVVMTAYNANMPQLRYLLNQLKQMNPNVKVFGYTNLQLCQDYLDWKTNTAQSFGLGAWAEFAAIGATGLDGIYIDGLQTPSYYAGATPVYQAFTHTVQVKEIEVQVLGAASGTFELSGKVPLSGPWTTGAITYSATPATLAGNIQTAVRAAASSVNAVVVTAITNAPAQTDDIAVVITGSQVANSLPWSWADGPSPGSLTPSATGTAPQVVCDGQSRLDHNNAIHYVHNTGPVGLGGSTAACAVMIGTPYDLSLLFPGAPNTPDQPALILGNDGVAFIDYLLLDGYLSKAAPGQNVTLEPPPHRLSRLAFARSYRSPQIVPVVQAHAGNLAVYPRQWWDQLYDEMAQMGMFNSANPALVGILPYGSYDWFLSNICDQMAPSTGQ